MATKLYVGGLPYSAKEEELKELFAAHGVVVSAAVIMDKFSGKSKGFGFIEMETLEEAQAAIDALNETDFGGRKIIVNIAREKTDDDRRGGGRRDGGYGGGGYRQNNYGSRRNNNDSFRYR